MRINAGYVIQLPKDVAMPIFLGGHVLFPKRTPRNDGVKEESPMKCSLKIVNDLASVMVYPDA